MSWIVGVDTGGTFTDGFAVNTISGATVCVKVSSTPDDPSRAIITALDELSTIHGVPLGELSSLAHGTTVGTNALIQRKGGRVAVLTTRGFRDLLEIGRQTRPSIFNLQVDSPAPLASRELRFEISERVIADGSVRIPLDDSSLPLCLEKMRSEGVDSCAVCLLFSFLNDEHELAIRKRLKELAPELRVSVSSEVQPEFREFERFNTTVINSYLQPVMESYIDRLARDLGQLTPLARVGINQSNGGLMSTHMARAFPVRTALSGPAAGAVGAVYVARQAAKPNILTVDVGGTSADVTLISDYRPNVTPERDVAGFPIRLPMIDIHTIGAGGGSIAWFDRDGLLKVGPQSSGSVPGPACYGRGGEQPTVSDANLILGRLSPALANGDVVMDRQLAVKAMQPIANRLNCTVEKAASSVLDIVVSNMVRALRTISVEEGHDPSTFVLMPFGGAGPLHARDIAIELGIDEILVPAVPGIVCAQGLLIAEQREDFVASRPLLVDQSCATEVGHAVGELDARAGSWFAEIDAKRADCSRELIIEARYVGQNFELRLPFGRFALGTPCPVPSMQQLLGAFFAEHERAYGYANTAAPVEIVNIRLTGLVKPADFAQEDLEYESVQPTPRTTRRVWFSPEHAVETPIYHRDDLVAGCEFVGPAVIEQLDTTISVYPGDIARVDHHGNILMRVNHD